MAAQQQQRPLALDYTAHGAAKGWRANEHLIDALPYVDHVPTELKAHVDTLIEEEKRRSTKLPSDYLRELPPVRAPQFDEHPVLKTEYERVRNKQPMQPLDNVRYRLDPPPQNKRGDMNAWKHALENAHSQLEHQHLRILNQELLLKHGDKSWRAQVQLDEAAVKSLEQQLSSIKKETDQLNRERKLQQHAAGAELSKLERQCLSQVRKDFQIERACDRLEEEVAAMEAEVQRRVREDTERGAAGAVGAAEVIAGEAQQQAASDNGTAEVAAVTSNGPDRVEASAAAVGPATPPPAADVEMADAGGGGGAAGGDVTVTAPAEEGPQVDMEEGVANGAPVGPYANGNT